MAGSRRHRAYPPATAAEAAAAAAAYCTRGWRQRSRRLFFTVFLYDSFERGLGDTTGGVPDDRRTPAQPLPHTHVHPRRSVSRHGYKIGV